MHVSLLDTRALLVSIGLAVVAALAILWAYRPRHWKRMLGALLFAGASSALTVWLVDDVWQPFTDTLPVVAVGAITGAMVAVSLAVAAPFSWRMVPVRIVAVILVVAVGGSLVNRHYDAYPTIRTALQLPPESQASLADAGASKIVSATGAEILADKWTPPANMPMQGTVSEVPIPGPTSGFVARPAWIYQPPAYLATPRAELPVLVLMAGQPGSPRDWLDGGNLVSVVDAYAAAHRGLAPVVLIVDQLGGSLDNPGCFDSPLGNVATYLRVDVPQWIEQNLAVTKDHSRWVIAGLSSGGTCSLQMATNAPLDYPNFLDISGEAEPEVASTHSETVTKAFGGDASKFRAVNPLDLLKAHQYPASNGIFVAGEDDKEYGPQARTTYEAARAAGMNVSLQVLPGNHGWKVWGPGLQLNLDWIAKTTKMER